VGLNSTLPFTIAFVPFFNDWKNTPRHSSSLGWKAEAVDMNGKFQMQGGKNWIFPKKVNANRFFWDSYWLEIWSNHF
jgi:hypothetical protein